MIRKKRKKLATHGGAIAGNVSVDVYSGYVHGRLIKSMGKAVESVKIMVDKYETEGYPVKLFAADKAIVSAGKFKVMTPETMQYLAEKHIKWVGAEPYNHANGTPHVEQVIRVIGDLID